MTLPYQEQEFYSLSYATEIALRRYNHGVASMLYAENCLSGDAKSMRRSAIRSFEEALMGLASSRKFEYSCTYTRFLLVLLYLEENELNFARNHLKKMGNSLRRIKSRQSMVWGRKHFVVKESLFEAFDFGIARYQDKIKNYKTAARYYTKTIVTHYLKNVNVVGCDSKIRSKGSNESSIALE